VTYQNKNTLPTIIALLFAVFGCADNGGGDKTSPASRSRPVTTIAHWQLLREYADNEVKANSQFTDKRITVTGPMDYVAVEKGKMTGRFSVPATSYTQLFAEFSDSERSSVEQIKSDQQVAVECTCLGITTAARLEMNDCVIK
jgi:tRNA_anti-like